MIKYVGQVVAEVLLGIGLWGLAGVIVVLAVWGITDGILYGFLLGLLLAAGYFIHMSILSACMYMHQLHAWWLGRS